MPVGCYSRAGGIQPTCGFAFYDRNFAMDDSPAAFFHPVHFQADIPVQVQYRNYVRKEALNEA